MLLILTSLYFHHILQLRESKIVIFRHLRVLPILLKLLKGGVSSKRLKTTALDVYGLHSRTIFYKNVTKLNQTNLKNREVNV